MRLGLEISLLDVDYSGGAPEIALRPFTSGTVGSDILWRNATAFTDTDVLENEEVFPEEEDVYDVSTIVFTIMDVVVTKEVMMTTKQPLLLPIFARSDLSAISEVNSASLRSTQHL